MFLTKYNPFQDFRNISKRFNQLERSFFEDLEKESSFTNFTPTVNTREGEYAYHVDVDLPGVKKDDIKINVSGNMLTISGERNSKKEVKEEDYHRIETSFGKFERTFTLPDEADTENITAANEDGVLEVTIPKLKGSASKVKQIKVK